MKYTKVLLGACSLVLLNGCLEVEDNNDKQIDIVIPENKVAIQGLVVDAFDNQAMANAQVSVYLGSMSYAENLPTTNGEFLIGDLPANSDVEVVISSENEEFVTRAFYLNTGNSTSGTAYNDLGMFSVSEPHQVHISVLDNEDNSSIENLEFVSYSHSGQGSTIDKYKHTSTYDAVTGSYTLIIPKFLTNSTMANADFDRDGVADYKPESYDSYSAPYLFIDDLSTQDDITLYVEEVVEPEAIDVEYRISVVDNSAAPILGAEFFVEGDNNTESSSVYDLDTNQYVINGKYLDQQTLNMPAFSIDGIHYQSVSVTLSSDDNGDLYVRTSGTDNNCCYTIPASETIELAIVAREVSVNSVLEVVALTEDFSQTNADFTVFYSQGVTVAPESVELKSTSGFSVVRGNESEDDLTLPGVTAIMSGIVVPTTVDMSLNNTKLTVRPDMALQNGERYSYSIEEVTVNSTEEVVDISDNSATFEYVDEEQVFDIYDIKLDNENYTTNGLTITPVNTANEAFDSINYSRNVQFYFPVSIQSLKNLTLRKVAKTENNIESSTTRFYDIVRDGQIYASSVGIVKVAENEVIDRDYGTRSIQVGTAMNDTQLVYRSSVYEYLSDNVSGNINSISFEYAYETKSGEVRAGSITIPVQ